MVTIAITPVNDGPVAVDDSYTLAEDTASLVGNLITETTGGAPDSDGDGDAPTVTGFTIAGEAGPFTLGVAYPITDGGNAVGSITINGNGSLRSPRPLMCTRMVRWVRSRSRRSPIH